jgi:uncharacterized protein YdiU (UPF0061 family)
MVAGFVHGVLNSDNMNVTGESFDYGPYRFLPRADPSFTAAYFDHGGLYAYGRQPQSVLWNLARLAETFASLAPVDRLAKALEGFGRQYFEAHAAGLLERLGLTPLRDERDLEALSLARAFLESSEVDYDRFFFDWYGGALGEARAAASPDAGKYAGEAFHALRRALDRHDPAPRTAELAAGAYFQRAAPCSLLIDEIEELWDAIAERDDWSPLEAKVQDIRRMAIALGRDLG